MKRYLFTLAFFVFSLLSSVAQPPEGWGRPGEQKAYVPNSYSTTSWDWSAAENTRPGVDLLVAYKVKEAFGARITFGSTIVNTTATYPDAQPDQMLNDLIAALGKQGLLSGIKGLDNSKKASITILSYETVRPRFIYSTEQLYTPSATE